MATYDPYDEELQLLDAQLKQALTSRLRSGGGGSPWGNAVRGVGDTLINSMDRRELEAKREQLVAQKRARQEEMMQAIPEELRGLAKLDPKAAIAEVLRDRTRQKETAEFEGFQRGDTSSGPEQLSGPGMGESAPQSEYSRDQLLRAAQHPNQRIAKWAESMLKMYHPEKVKQDEIYPTPDGGYGTRPGVLSHALNVEKAKATGKGYGEVEWQTDPNNPTRQIPTSRTALLENAAGARALPGATGGLPLPGAPSGAPNNLNSGGSPAPGSSFPPFAGPASNQVQSQLDLAVLQDPSALPQAKAAAAARVAGQGGQAPVAPAGPSRSSPLGDKLNQQRAEEIPKLEASFYGAQEMLGKMGQLEKDIKNTPGWWAGSTAGGVLAKTLDSAGLMGKDKMQALQGLNSAETALMGPMMRDAGFGANQGFTDKDREFVRQRLPSADKTQSMNERGLQEIKQYFAVKQQQAAQRIKSLDPTWEPPAHPTEPAPEAKPAPAAGRKTSALEGVMNAIVPSAQAAGGMPDPHVQDAQQGNTLTGALKDRWVDFAEGAGYGAGTNMQGYGQLLGVQGQQDVADRRANAPERNFTGKVGEFAGEALLDPTNAIPGAGVLKMALKGGISGFTKPSASNEEAAAMTAVSAATGGLGEKLSSLIPKTSFPKGAAAARKGFEDIPLTQGQIAGGVDTNFLPTGRHAAEGIAPRQIKALTEKLMASTGSDSKVITSAALNAREAELKSVYNRLFPETRPMKLGTQDAMQLTTAMAPYKEVFKSPDFIERAPAIAQLYNHAERTVTRGKPRAIPANLVQSAIQDVARVENPRMQLFLREELSNLAKKNLSPSEVTAFEQLNKQWGNLADIRRMGYRNGMITPRTIKGPPGSDAEAASDFVNRFGVQNPKEWIDVAKSHGLGSAGAAVSAATGTPYGLLMAAPLVAHAGSRVGGAVQGTLNTSGVLNADPNIKNMIEMLRLGTRYGPREYVESGRQ